MSLDVSQTRCPWLQHTSRLQWPLGTPIHTALSAWTCYSPLKHSGHFSAFWSRDFWHHLTPASLCALHKCCPSEIIAFQRRQEDVWPGVSDWRLLHSVATDTAPGFIADLVREHCREQHKRNLWLTQQKRWVVWQLSQSSCCQNITGYFCHSHLTNSTKPSMPGALHRVSFGSKPPHSQPRLSTLHAATQILNRRRAELSRKSGCSAPNGAGLRQGVQLRDSDFS